jgi:Na+/H+ antiporter NhaC
VNTYEITLVVEFIVLTSLAYAVIPAFSTMTEASTTAQIIAYTLNSVNFIFAIMLLFASPLFLDGFKDVFTVTGFICSLALAGVLEYVTYEQRNGRRLPL